MDYEKKYKRALERAKDYHKQLLDEDNPEWASKIENIFPELNESKDERIRKEIIQYIKDTNKSGYLYDEEWIDWLEKQGESIKIKKGKNYLCTKTHKYAGVEWIEGVKYYSPEDYSLVNQGCTCYCPKYSKEEHNNFFKEDEYNGWLEKKDEQKSIFDFNANNWYVSKVDGKIHNIYNSGVEPKFHEGDWVVWQDKYYKVNYNDCRYELIDQNGLSTSLEHGTIDESAHLWDISDAKDGDVLAYITDEEDLWIMIYWSLYEPYEGHVHYHALLVNDDFSDKGTCCICINDLKPATKEQRDTLFTKMNEVGYEFDFKDKELRKIEKQAPKPKWSEEDDKNLESIDIILFKDKTLAKENYWKMLDWIKSLKQRVGE